MVLTLMRSQAATENGYTENTLIDIVLVYGTVSRVSFVGQSQMSYVMKCQKDSLPSLRRGRSASPLGRSYVLLSRASLPDNHRLNLLASYFVY